VTRRNSAVPGLHAKKAAAKLVELRPNFEMLASMRERAEMLGGKLEIKADPGNGTIVKAEVPVNGDSGK
jgi:signal transduction histidine kinase